MRSAHRGCASGGNHRRARPGRGSNSGRRHPDRSSPAAVTPVAATQAAAPAKPDIALSNKKAPKVRKQKKDEKVVLSKDTKKEDKKVKKINPIEAQDAKLPDKALYDKAMDAVKRGRYDVARLDLQTLLNTYPDSQYMMRAKLGVADSWFKEGGTAALTQAEQEYKDFITFFPNAPEAAEAQMRVGDIYFRQMDKPDRDYSNTTHAEEEYRLMLQQFPDSIRWSRRPNSACARCRRRWPPAKPILPPFTPPTPTGPPPSPATRPSSIPTRSTATWTTCW